MAVVSKDVSARVVLSNPELKQIASFSGVDLNVSADNIMSFRNGMNALTTQNIGNMFLEITTELTKEEEGA